MGSTRRRTVVTTLVAVALALGAVPQAPAAAQAPPPPDVGYVGDSLGVESEVEIRRELRGRRPFTVLARTNGAYVAWVRRHWVRPILRDPPSALVVTLGHGDANKYISVRSWRADVRAFLAEVVPHVDCVRWLDLRQRRSYYAPVNARAARYNRVLREEAARWRKVEVVHYSAWVDLVGDGPFERDLMHLTQRGEDALARMVRVAADGCDRAVSSGPFWDVPDHHPSAPAVRWLADQGILREGFGNGTFRAELGGVAVPLERRDLARWLWRREGRPAAPPPRWRDVPAGLRPAVGWLTQQHLLRGMPDGTFRPQRLVRRGELVRALWLLAGAPTDAPPTTLTDVSPALAAAVAWAEAEGLVTGFGNGTFRAGFVVTRAQAARWLAPADLPPPGPRPAWQGPFPPPRVLGGTAPRHRTYLQRCTDVLPTEAC